MRARQSLICLMFVTVAAMVTSCGDGVGPSLEPTEFSLCSKPNWIAVSNGTEWQLIDVPEPQVPFGPVRVSAHLGPRPSVAVGFSGSTLIYQLQREELAQLRCPSSIPTGTVRTITGTVGGIADTDIFQLAHGPNFGFRFGPGAFNSGIRDTVATIIATRRVPGALRATGTLLIRDFRSHGESAFPPIDFASPNVRVLDSAQLSLSATGSGVFRATALRTGGTSLSVESSTSGSVTHYFALSGPRHADDLYTATVTSGNKSVTWHYGDLVNTAVQFGPELAAISTATVPDATCRRLAASIPVQSGLESGARITFNFGTHRFNVSVSVLVSQGFRGTSDIWEAEIPVIGSGTPCLAPTGTGATVAVTAYGGNFDLVLGAQPKKGDLIRSVTFTTPAP